MKKEAESGPETDDLDSDSGDDNLREKALLVCFWISCTKLLTVFIIDFCQAELEKIRKGKQLKDKRPKKKLKKEEKPITVFTPGEIIDLT